MDQPRIIHIDSGRSWRGGQRQVFLLATGLRDLGYRVLVVAPTGSPLIRRAERAGLPTYRLTLRGEWDIRSARELRAVAREWGADIVHAHDARSHSIARFALLGKRKIRFIVTRRVAFPPKQVCLKYRHGVDAFIANALREVAVRQAGHTREMVGQCLEALRHLIGGTRAVKAMDLERGAIVMRKQRLEEKRHRVAHEIG